MTLNLGYGIGISSKQRHKRHLRHYRHTRAARGSGVHPRNAFVDIQTLCLQNMFPLKAGGGNQSGCAYKFVYTPEWISLDSSKNLDSKKWIGSDSFPAVASRKLQLHHENYNTQIPRHAILDTEFIYERLTIKSQAPKQNFREKFWGGENWYSKQEHPLSDTRSV